MVWVTDALIRSRHLCSTPATYAYMSARMTSTVISLFQRPPAAAVAVGGLCAAHRRVACAEVAAALMPARAQAQVMTHADLVAGLAVAALEPARPTHLPAGIRL